MGEGEEFNSNKLSNLASRTTRYIDQSQRTYTNRGIKWYRGRS